MDSPDPKPGCPDRVFLERIAAGEPVEDEIRQHVSICEACAKVLAEIRERDRFLGLFAGAGAKMPRPADEGHETTQVFGPLAQRGSDATDDRDRSIGPYALIQILGEGGFGQVWLAKRLDPFIQRVAIKVIKLGMDSAAVIARFEQERQALAMMDHPNIARVLDGGVAPVGGWGSGRPYFVMEYVDGEPITEYCDRRNLGTRERLAIFLSVCDAVEHAHMKGIIHRDIKPSNILVMDADGKGVPKIIDFGIAKAIGGSLTEKTIFTEHGQFIGTPEYMSPEQLEAGPRDIDTRTDVYSLGVLLYELLAGARPFDVARLRSAGFEEIRRIIREVDPPKPSARLTTMNEVDGGSVASHRRTSRNTLARELKRELDWIPLMAMRKDRRKRYASPSELARDVRNYLEGKALQAGPESAGYRIGKVVRRHKVAFLAGGMAIFGLVGGLAMALHALGLEHQARVKEYEQRLLAEQSVVFLEDAIGAADPLLRAADRPKTLQEVINGALKKLDSGALQGQPAAEARLRRVMGLAFLGIGNWDLSVTQLEQSLKMQRELPNADTSDVTRTELWLCDAMARAKHGEQALSIAKGIADRRIKEGGANDLLAAEAFRIAGSSARQLGQYAEAEPLLRQALGIERAAAPGSEPLAETLAELETLMLETRRFDEAAVFADEALGLFRTLLGPTHPFVMTILSNEGRSALDREDLPQAQKLLDEVVELAAKEGTKDVGLGTTLLLRAKLEATRGEYDNAVTTGLQALDLLRSVEGGDQTVIAKCRLEISRALRAGGHGRECLQMLEEGLEELRPHAEGSYVEFRTLLWETGLARARAGDHAGAVTLFAEVEQLIRKAKEPEPERLATVLSDRAWSLVLLGRADEAATVAEESLREPSLPITRRGASLQSLGRAHMLRGDFAGAEPVLREGLEVRQKARDGDGMLVQMARSTLGRCLCKSGRLDEGLELLRQAAAGLKPSKRSKETRQEAIGWLAEGLEAAGKAEEAASWRKQLEEEKQ